MLPNAVLDDIWYAVRKDVPRVAEFAIPKFWAQAPLEYGSVMGPERSGPDGYVYQSFTRKVLRWSQAKGVEVAA